MLSTSPIRITQIRTSPFWSVLLRTHPVQHRLHPTTTHTAPEVPNTLGRLPFTACHAMAQPANWSTLIAGSNLALFSISKSQLIACANTLRGEGEEEGDLTAAEAATLLDSKGVPLSVGQLHMLASTAPASTIPLLRPGAPNLSVSPFGLTVVSPHPLREPLTAQAK